MTVGALTRQTLLLAGQTWQEGIRRRMLYVGFGLSLCFLVLYGLGVYFAFRHWQNWATAGNMGGDSPAAGLTSPEAIRDLAAYNMLSLAMFVSSFLGVMLAVFLASGMISGDKENGTLQTIVTRPMGRWQILLGRFLGFASIYLVYVVVLDTALIAVTRLFADFVPAAPIEAVALLSVQGLILLGLTSVITVLLPPIANGHPRLHGVRDGLHRRRRPGNRRLSAQSDRRAPGAGRDVPHPVGCVLPHGTARPATEDAGVGLGRDAGRALRVARHTRLETHLLRVALHGDRVSHRHSTLRAKGPVRASGEHRRTEPEAAVPLERSPAPSPGVREQSTRFGQEPMALLKGHAPTAGTLVGMVVCGGILGLLFPLMASWTVTHQPGREMWSRALCVAAGITAGGLCYGVAQVTVYRTMRTLSTPGTHDSLTSLANRRQFIHVLGVELSRALRFHQPLSLIVADWTTSRSSTTPTATSRAIRR